MKHSLLVWTTQEQETLHRLLVKLFISLTEQSSER